MQQLAVIDMHGLDGPLVVLALLVVLVLLRIPATRGVLLRLARRIGDWVTTHWERTEQGDRDKDELWLMQRRRKLH